MSLKAKCRPGLLLSVVLSLACMVSFAMAQSPQLDAVNAGLPPLTFQAALQLSLNKNHQLDSARHEVAAVEQEGLQFGLRPNPELELELEEFGGSGDYSGTDSSSSIVRINQLLERGGKRNQRQILAQQQTHAAQQSLTLTQTELSGQVRQRFTDVLLAQQQLRLAQQQRTQALSVLESVVKGVEAGKKARVEALQFKSLAAKAQLRYSEAQSLLENRRQILATSWNGVSSDFGEVVGDISQRPVLPDWTELEDMVAQAPLLQWQQQQHQVAQTELALEKANAVQDVTVGLGVKNDYSNNDVAFLASFSMPLALFDSNQGAIAAAHSRVSRVEAEMQEQKQELRRQLLIAFRASQSAVLELEMVQQELLPAAQQVFEAVSFGYELGKYDVIEVLDAQGRLLESEDLYLDALSRYYQQVNTLSRLLGREFITL